MFESEFTREIIGTSLFLASSSKLRRVVKTEKDRRDAEEISAEVQKAFAAIKKCEEKVNLKLKMCSPETRKAFEEAIQNQLMQLLLSSNLTGFGGIGGISSMFREAVEIKKQKNKKLLKEEYGDNSPENMNRLKEDIVSCLENVFSLYSDVGNELIGDEAEKFESAFTESLKYIIENHQSSEIHEAVEILNNAIGTI